MRMFRRDKRAPQDVADHHEDEPKDSAGSEPVEAISAAPLGEAERARIETSLAELEAAGVDVDDLAALGAAFDAAVDRDDSSVLPVLAVGVGEHLHRHAELHWAVVTDSFGRDLGLQGHRRDMHVVPDSLLSARWMRRERGWLERTVRHLIDTSVR